MILLQLGLGQAILWDVALQISRQLHGQRTYFFPGGAFLMGYRRVKQFRLDKKENCKMIIEIEYSSNILLLLRDTEHI